MIFLDLKSIYLSACLLVGIYTCWLVCDFYLEMVFLDSNSISNITDIDSIIGLSLPARVILIVWTCLVIVLGILGNALVLVGSIKYKALKMDKISIFLLECLAVTGIAIVLFDFVPSLITIIANKWILGEAFCVFTSVDHWVLYASDIVFITCIAASRTYLLAKPFAWVPQMTYFRKVRYIYFCYVCFFYTLYSPP